MIKMISKLTRQYDAYLHRVMIGERNRFLKKYLHRKSVFTSFSDLSPQELIVPSDDQMKFPKANCFTVGDAICFVKDEKLYEALKSLSEEERKLVLCFYYGKFKPCELARLCHIEVDQIYYQKNKILTSLREILEGG